MKSPVVIFALVLLSWSSTFAQPAPSTRLARISVTDAHRRWLTGLELEHFEIREKGIARPVRSFTSSSDSLAIAIVATNETIEPSTLPGPGRLIQTSTLADALRQLAESTQPFKILVLVAPVSPAAVPPEVITVRTEQHLILKAVIEICNQYFVEFDSADPAAPVEVILKQPRGLPLLQAMVAPDRPIF